MENITGLVAYFVGLCATGSEEYGLVGRIRIQL